MGKLVSEKEARLQKRLVPVNIAVCVLCLVAAITLFLCPILTVDIGKMLHDDKLQSSINSSVNGLMGEGFSIASSEKINYAPVMSGIAVSTLDKVDVVVSVSAVDAYAVLNDEDGQKSRELVDSLLFGDTGIITGTVNGIIDGIVTLISSEETRRTIENSLVAAVSAALLAGTEFALPEDKLTQIADTFKRIETLEDGNVAPVIDELIEELLGENADAIPPETRQKVIDEIQTVYDNTAAHLGGEPVTYEAILCVAVSSNVDITKFDLASVLKGMFENTDDPSGNGESGAQDNGAQDNGALSVKPFNADDGGTSENEFTVVTSYAGLFEAMGLTEENIDALKTEIKTSLVSVIEPYTDGATEYVAYYGYVFYGMLAFITPWLLLFTFSLIHMFANNKRFMMWYVKLVCWIPSAIWLALRFAPALITKFAPAVSESGAGWIIDLVFGCVNSYTWINGLCYCILWLISIFWAFPIKHKIRIERKDAGKAERAGITEDDGGTII